MYKKIRDLHSFKGKASLYKLANGKYVVASAISNRAITETLIFPADEEGAITSWEEIGGGEGYFDHQKALDSVDQV